MLGLDSILGHPRRSTGGQAIPSSVRSVDASMNDLTLREAQERVDEWIRTVGIRYYSELTNLAVLVEEVGEVARLMSRLYGDQSFKKSDEGRELADELADVLFVLICLANQTGVDLTAAFEGTMTKKTNRDRERHANNPKLRGQESHDQRTSI